MRALLLSCVVLAGCDPAGGMLLGVNAASIVVMQRTPPDLVASILTGRDCSIVHVDHDAPYCAPGELPLLAPPYCTRSLGGGSDCWAIETPPIGHEVADQRPLNAAQEANRRQGWFRGWLGL